MSDKQKQQAVALIKKLCCNYDSGNCLVLSGWDHTPCPQCASNSLMCKYFRDVLLEDREGQTLKAQIIGDENLKTCQMCGKPFQAISNRAKYCRQCSSKVEKDKATERKRKQRGKYVTV